MSKIEGNLMKISLTILLLSLAATNCSTSDRYGQMESHPFWTDSCCRRTKPIGKFDARCDAPKLGYKNFCPPPVIGGSP
ncbi:hypothetical protein [Rhizobium acaciae]|uniref:hypothetical protein n=1 Tax=Rhizobium acaciae TaxID=2989736 RepID=UPI003F9C9BA6